MMTPTLARVDQFVNRSKLTAVADPACDMLRDVVKEWATSFEKANPSRKYLKQREKKLFEACKALGIV